MPLPYIRMLISGGSIGILVTGKLLNMPRITAIISQVGYSSMAKPVWRSLRQATCQIWFGIPELSG